MSVNLKTILKSPLMVGACLTATVTLVGTMYALTHPRSMVKLADSSPSGQATSCKTVVFDDKPPLNVRATPAVQPGNIVASLNNGETVTVVGEQDGWLKISAPTTGWVYQNLTRQKCEGDPPAARLSSRRVVDPALEVLPDESGTRLYREAVSQFQAGNLPGAIKLAQMISADSAAYPHAQTALKIMPQAWDQAKVQYQKAVNAEKQSRWNDVLKIAIKYPDIRYWREKLTPIVKKAIRMQYFAESQADQ
ncbi:SH3 domain-containing protein [Cyanobacteria bacterium FACHB-DQ100]|uniref:SH3 domain-containing protein n=1 Tax=Leptolyngbya sp. DQ-M1 TaxID=2933920 RepID=UPI0019AB45FF|nr:SH3 domain-containing protein [Cyanobacteria bacterium FACHB-DQ100]